MVTLHHFVHPLWFDALGGFTTDAGIPHFVSFATFAVRCAACTFRAWSNSGLAFDQSLRFQKNIILCKPRCWAAAMQHGRMARSK